MDSIVKYACEELDGAEISCLMVGGDPWFCGVEVARALGYKDPNNTVYKMDAKYKCRFSFLLSRSGIAVQAMRDANDLKASWINEAGLYKLVLKSKLKSAEVFQDWVCMEVLPAIRKTGFYSSDQ